MTEEQGQPGNAGPGEPPSGIDWDRLVAQLAAQPEEEGWVDLSEASRASGVSRSTLRSWYRKGIVPSRMVASRHGPQRLVLLEAVLEQATTSPKFRRRLDDAHSLQSQIDDLRLRVEELERFVMGPEPHDP